MLRIDVVTIFPVLFEPFARESMVGIACQRGKADLQVHDLRDWTSDRHRTVDDSPYGGGPGMVMKPEPLVAAIESLAGEKGPSHEAREGRPSREAREGRPSREAREGRPSREAREGRPSREAREGRPGRKARVILLSPQGRRLEQERVEQLAREEHLVLVCGRYEGVDQRVIDLAVDEEISIGDYVLCGGEVAAMALIEATMRMLPGVLGNPESTEWESFQKGLLEGPQFTRPPEFRGHGVPEVLLSGDHGKVASWREARALERTKERRPDLIRTRQDGEGD